MIIWDVCVIALCKLVYQLLRVRGSHGAALPGLIAEKLHPRLINKLCALPEGIIVVSGTNGKTTTTHLIAEVLRRSGKQVFTNHSGSNMTRGLLASIVRYARLDGKLHHDIAVLEIDEAYAAKLSPILQPRASVLTNVLRDQLDRFGEIDHTAKLLGELAENTTEVVVYNAADKRLRPFKNRSGSARYVSFGFDQSLADHFPDDDALYAHQERRLPATYDIELKTADDKVVVIAVHRNTVKVRRHALPGWHNILNLTAAIAVVKELYPDVDVKIFEDIHPPYGRGEVIQLGKKEYTLQLVKNPAGFRTAMDVEPELPALIIINDLIADGRDVSWLWDVDILPLSGRPSVSTAGTRGYDMAVRLKYAGVTAETCILDQKKAIESFVLRHEKGVIFLTYTAMLESRKVLKEMAK